MDYLKTQATFWKSVKRNGEQQWIESKASDQQAAARWDGSDDKMILMGLFWLRVVQKEWVAKIS